MVILMRIDERLLHGQVALTWVNDVHPDAILIANDEAAQNEMARLALKVAKPQGVKLAIKTVDEGAKLLNDKRAANIKIFVIVRTLQDALALVKQSRAIHKINIGAVRKKEGAKQYCPSVFLDHADLQTLQALCAYVDHIEFRMVPSQQEIDARKILKEGCIC